MHLRVKTFLNGKSALIPVSIWVVDEAGNKDYCNTYVLFQDNGTADRPEGVCKDTTLTPAAILVNGTLFNESKEAIEKATVKVVANGVKRWRMSSRTQQVHMLTHLYLTKEIYPSRLCATTTQWMVSVRSIWSWYKTYYRGKTFSSPYKMIAADVDHNNEINVIDLLELRKISIGVYDAFPKQRKLEVYSGSLMYSMIPPIHGHIRYLKKMDGLDHDVQVEFTGVKVGMSTAAPYLIVYWVPKSGESSGGLVLKVKDQSVKKASVYRFHSMHLILINTLVGKVHCLMKDCIWIHPGGAGFQSRKPGRQQETEDLLSMSWNDQASDHMMKTQYYLLWPLPPAATSPWVKRLQSALWSRWRKVIRRRINYCHYRSGLKTSKAVSVISSQLYQKLSQSI